MSAISASNLQFFLSGGASNSNPAASLGGVISSSQVGTAIDSLFADVSSAQAASGYTAYRCIYFKNVDSNANGLMSPVAAWLSQLDTDANETVTIGLDPAGKNASATTIANETTAPSGVTFSSPSSFGAGLSLPSSPYMQNDYIGIWIKRVTNAGAASDASVSMGISVQGDTA